MMLQDLIEKFISLAEGKLTPHEWVAWFTAHKETVEKNSQFIIRFHRQKTGDLFKRIRILKNHSKSE
ncbi:hypothetical protein [Chryseobacterium carnipullorum]|uniref:hypothetical protein n=1 Tax=Chryseobacterium carnipullorum TaxID=1124835 RepID=UPI0023F2A83C|nr:hypothetical protein [Chryseobacterium carnipullorum]MDN5476066.1 hypothetical protein [Chryseobacterium sp.]